MLDKSLAVLAGRQHGVLSRAQVLATGGDDGFIAWRLRTEAWAPVAPGVYGLPGWPPTWKRSLWIAHLAVGPGSVVSHQAAAALHAFYTFQPGPVVLTVVHGDHERRGPWTVRHSTDLRPSDITTAEGLLVTTPARTLFDLSAVLSRPHYERVLDDAPHGPDGCRPPQGQGGSEPRLASLPLRLRGDHRPARHGLSDRAGCPFTIPGT